MSIRIWLGSLALLAAAAAPCLAQDLAFEVTVNRAITTPRGAMLALPPELIARPKVTQFAASPDGRYVIVVRQSASTAPLNMDSVGFTDPQLHGATHILLWNSASRIAREVWRVDSTTASVDTLVWLPGSRTALVALSDENVQGQAAVRISADLGQAEALPRPAAAIAPGIAIDVSPRRPLAALRWTDVVPVPEAAPVASPRMELRCTLTVVGDRGAAMPDFPVEPHAAPIAIRWTADGEPVVELYRRRTPDRAAARTWWLIDRRLGRLTKLDGPPDEKGARPAAPATLPDCSVRVVSTALPAGDTASRTGALWLESSGRNTALPPGADRPRVLLSSDATRGELLAGGETVIYTAHGSAWAAPLAALTAAQYLALVRRAVLRSAKEVGLAAAMYAADYDDHLPPSADVNNLLTPYLKDPSALAGFQYALDGNALGDISQPATTVLGTLAGGGGTAIIYVDGHVRWKQ